jgi:hypothetical protein
MRGEPGGTISRCRGVPRLRAPGVHAPAVPAMALMRPMPISSWHSRCSSRLPSLQSQFRSRLEKIQQIAYSQTEEESV